MISFGFIYIFPHECQFVVSVSSCPDIHMPGFAQHRGDHVQVNASLPALGYHLFLEMVFSHVAGVVCVSCLALHTPFLKQQRDNYSSVVPLHHSLCSFRKYSLF